MTITRSKAKKPAAPAVSQEEAGVLNAINETHFIPHRSEPVQLSFETSVRVEIDQILPNPYQPAGRLKPSKEVLDKIVVSIKEHGLIQVPVVRRVDGHFEMGDGWQRLCAYRQLFQAGNKEYGLIPVTPRELTDRQMADLVIEANMVRSDLSPIDLAKFYVKYLDDFHISQAELGRIHNVSQADISNTIRLLDLPEEVQAKVITHEIPESHARTLLSLGKEGLEDTKKVNSLVKRIVDGTASVASLDQEIKRAKWDASCGLGEDNYSNKPAFDTKYCLGTCTARESMPELYGGGKKVARCTNKDCWTEKQEAGLVEQNKELMAELAKKGITRLLGSIDWHTMTRLYGNLPNECKSCDKRAAAKSYGTNVDIVCTDNKCAEAKDEERQKADDKKREAERRSQEIEKQQRKKNIEEVFAGINPADPETLLTAIDCLLTAAADNEELLYDFNKAFNLVKLEVDEDGNDNFDEVDGEKIMAAVRENVATTLKVDAREYLTRLIVRLAFEHVRCQYSTDADITRLLNAFKGGATATEKKPRRKQTEV